MALTVNARLSTTARQQAQQRHARPSTPTRLRLRAGSQDALTCGGDKAAGQASTLRSEERDAPLAALGNAQPCYAAVVLKAPIGTQAFR